MDIKGAVAPQPGGRPRARRRPPAAGGRGAVVISDLDEAGEPESDSGEHERN